MMGGASGCCAENNPNFDAAMRNEAQTKNLLAQSHESATYKQPDEKDESESSKTNDLIEDTMNIVRKMENNNETPPHIPLSDDRSRNSFDEDELKEETKLNIDGENEVKYHKKEKKKHKRKHKNKLVSTLKECIKEFNKAILDNIVDIIGFKDINTNTVNMEQLDTKEICRHFKGKKYDIEWFLITPRNKFIIIMVNQWPDISILTAITIYESMRIKLHNIIPSVTKSSLDLLTDKNIGRNKSQDNIVFTWKNNMKDIKECDYNEFLYIVSLIIKVENQEILKSNTLQSMVGKYKPLYAQEDILTYLLDIKMDGYLFKGINRDILYKNMCKFVTEFNERIDESEEFEKQYITSLYSKIDEYDVTVINKQKVCTIEFNWSRSQRFESVTSLIKTMHVSMSFASGDEDDDEEEYSESIQIHDDDDEKLKPLPIDSNKSQDPKNNV